MGAAAVLLAAALAALLAPATGTAVVVHELSWGLATPTAARNISLTLPAADGMVVVRFHFNQSSTTNHTVTSGHPSAGAASHGLLFDSPEMASGVFEVNFTAAGVFHFFCRLHPTLHGTATIAAALVADSSGSGSSSTVLIAALAGGGGLLVLVVLVVAFVVTRRRDRERVAPAPQSSLVRRLSGKRKDFSYVPFFKQTSDHSIGPHKPVPEWTATECREWLDVEGFGDFAAVFAARRIAGPQLLQLRPSSFAQVHLEPTRIMELLHAIDVLARRRPASPGAALLGATTDKVINAFHRASMMVPATDKAAEPVSGRSSGRTTPAGRLSGQVTPSGRLSRSDSLDAELHSHSVVMDDQLSQLREQLSTSRHPSRNTRHSSSMLVRGASSSEYEVDKLGRDDFDKDERANGKAIRPAPPPTSFVPRPNALSSARPSLRSHASDTDLRSRTPSPNLLSAADAGGPLWIDQLADHVRDLPADKRASLMLPEPTKLGRVGTAPARGAKKDISSLTRTRTLGGGVGGANNTYVDRMAEAEELIQRNSVHRVNLAHSHSNGTLPLSPMAGDSTSGQVISAAMSQVVEEDEEDGEGAAVAAAAEPMPVFSAVMPRFNGREMVRTSKAAVPGGIGAGGLRPKSMPTQQSQRNRQASIFGADDDGTVTMRERVASVAAPPHLALRPEDEEKLTALGLDHELSARDKSMTLMF